MTDARDIDCPKCAKSGDDCGEHSPSWEELVDYWRNEAASLRKQLEDARAEALEEAAECAERYPSPMNDLPMALAIRSVAKAIRALIGKS